MLDNESFNELMKDIAKDTGFVVASDDALMSSCIKVTTPLLVLNCIYGGGLPLGIISEVSGPPSSGKSTFLYQCMGNYQREYPDGVPVVYDMEASWDNDRMKLLGVDTTKVLRMKSSSIESAFGNMFKILNKISKIKEDQNKDISSFQIYDSISTGGTEKQHTAAEDGRSAFGAGSMMEAPRVIKQNLSNVLPYLEKFPVYIGLINQVFVSPGQFVSKVESGGGFGLKHICHTHITFGENKDTWSNGFIEGTTSMVKLSKSKLSPKFQEIPCYMDAKKSGRIDEVRSFIEYIIRENVGFIKAKAWWNMSETLDKIVEQYNLNKESLMKYYRNYRKDDMIQAIREDPDILNLLQIHLIDFINEIYPGQKTITEEYKNKLISKCKYFNDIKIVVNEDQVVENIEAEVIVKESESDTNDE